MTTSSETTNELSTNSDTGIWRTAGSAPFDRENREVKLSRLNRLLRDDPKRDWLPAALAALTFLTIQNGQALACSIGSMPSMSLAGVIRERPELLLPIEQIVSKMSLTCDKGLLTGIVDRSTKTASFYLTLELKNSGKDDREAEADLVMPEGAVLSRATLWVNGVPQEAAFNTADRTTNAYNWITQKHRDPLLVTYKDENTVHFKASPVPAGGKMKLRLGITSPLGTGASTNEHMEDNTSKGSITLPFIDEANFGLGQSNKVSIKAIDNGGDMRAGASNSQTLLSQNLSNADIKSTVLSSSTGPLPFAVRAVHGTAGSVIVVQEAPDDEGLKLTRTYEKPSCRFIDSESAASRVTTLWARNEVLRLLRDGRKAEAEALCEIYRIVTPISGAIVMELDSDYMYQGLRRNFYMTDSSRPGTAAQVPTLMGATSGSIAPQNTGTLQGASNDGLMISGVNTAGTVNLASANLGPSSWADCIDLAFILAGLVFVFKGLIKLFSEGIRKAASDLITGLSMIYMSFAWLIALPILVLMRLYKKHQNHSRQG